MAKLQFNYELTREEVLERIIELAEAGVGSGFLCLARVGLALSLTEQQMSIVRTLVDDVQLRHVRGDASMLRYRLRDLTETQKFFFELIEEMPQDSEYASHKSVGGRLHAEDSLYRFVTGLFKSRGIESTRVPCLAAPCFQG